MYTFLRILPLSLAALLLLAGTSEAQLQGIVQDSAGVPVADVTVEVWGASPMPIGVRNDRSGAFRVPADLLLGGQRLAFRRRGYETRVLDLPVTSPNLVVTLDPQPVILPGLTAVALPTRVSCPQSDDPAARQLWELVRSRYSPSPRGSAYRAMMLLGYEEFLRLEHIDLPEERMIPRLMYWPAGGDAPNEPQRALDDRVRADGYARALPWEQPGYRSFMEEYFAWNYLQLFSYRAEHLISSTFGSLHTFRFVRSSVDETVLAFCPATTNAPSIQGLLTVSGDTSLLNARLTFRTGPPNEDAGVEVTFPARDSRAGSTPPLLPERSTFWRRMFGTKRFERYSYHFEYWEIGPEVRPWGENGARQTHAE